MKKILFFFLILIALSMLLQGCTLNNDLPSTVGEIAFDSGYSGDHIVYVREDSEYVPYIVITNDYQGNCLLLRQNVMNTVQRLNDYDAYYDNCEIDRYLNNDFLLTLGTFANKIVQSNITITDKSSLGCSGDNTKKISRKAFLLSLTEICINDSINTGIEGSPLNYFKDLNNRIAYKGSKTANWWLRTPNSYYSSCVYVVGSNGKIGYGNAFDENGIRPAFCVSSSESIISSADSITGDIVFLFTDN